MLCRKLQPTPVEMNLTLGSRWLRHDDLNELLKQIRNSGLPSIMIQRRYTVS